MKFNSFFKKTSLCLGLCAFVSAPITAGFTETLWNTTKQVASYRPVKYTVTGLVGAWATYRYAPRVLHGSYSLAFGDGDNILAALEGIKKNRKTVKGVKEEIFALRSLLVQKIDTAHKAYVDGHNRQSDELSDAAIALNATIFENRSNVSLFTYLSTPYLDAHLKYEKYRGFIPKCIVDRYQAVKRPCADWFWSFTDDEKILVTYGGQELYQACKGLKKAAQNVLKGSNSHKAVKEQVDVFAEHARIVLKFIKSLDAHLEARQDDIEQVARLLLDVEVA